MTQFFFFFVQSYLAIRLRIDRGSRRGALYFSISIYNSGYCHASIYMCPDVEKGYSARDLVITESCRVGN